MRTLSLFILLIITLLAVTPVAAQTPPTGVIATTTEAVELYAWPSTRTPTVGNVAAGTTVTVHYTEDSRIGDWVQVTTNTLSGWMLADTLTFEDSQWRRHVPQLTNGQLYDPAFSELDTIAPPFTAHSGWCRNSMPRLFSQPFWSRDWIFTMATKEPIEVIALARMNGIYSQYVLIRHVESGTEGWIRYYCVSYDTRGYWEPIGNLGFINQNLPVIDFTFYNRAEDSVDSLPATVNADTALNAHATDFFGHWESSDHIPLGYVTQDTPVTLTGRTDCEYVSDCWLEVTAGTQRGWVWAGYLTIQGDYLKLPIVPR